MGVTNCAIPVWLCVFIHFLILKIITKYIGLSMKKQKSIFLSLVYGFFATLVINANAIEQKPKACIVSVETGKEYCLSVGQWSGYSLPNWISGKEVYVNAQAGTKILLSDWDNLSYDRIAGFVGTVEPRGLNNKQAWNGQALNFSQPRSMRVVSSNEALGCIVSVKTGKKYCLPVGQRSGYSLPEWIRGEEVYVSAAEGTKVLLSDWDNLSYDRIAGFVGTVESSGLNNKQAWSGQTLNFSRPRSMSVVSSNEALGCIVSVETGDKYCLPVGQRSGYSLPKWIKGKEVYVNASAGTKVLLSDWDNLSYSRIAGFVGTVEQKGLSNQYAWNGDLADFSHPRSMQVVRSSVALGCIVSVETSEKYCLPAGHTPRYTLPNWIRGKKVYVDAEPGTKVLLSDWDNLSYSRIAVFTGKVDSNGLTNKRAWNGDIVDFSHPHSMGVWSDK
jgi:hypothetical protein